MKRTLVYSRRDETRRQNGTLIKPQLGTGVRQLKIFTTLHMSVNDCEIAMVTDFGVTNAFCKAFSMLPGTYYRTCYKSLLNKSLPNPQNSRSVKSSVIYFFPAWQEQGRKDLTLTSYTFL